MARDFNKLRLKVERSIAVPRHLRDLVDFVAYLEEHHGVTVALDDEKLVLAADSFWDSQHGDD